MSGIGLRFADQRRSRINRLTLTTSLGERAHSTKVLDPSKDDRRYEIKSDKTDHVALQKGAALRRSRRQA